MSRHLLAGWVGINLFATPAAAAAIKPPATSEIGSSARPAVGPPAIWVEPLPIPAASKDSQQTAVSVLLLDRQTKLSEDGDATYSNTAFRIGSAQGLQAAGLALAWDPALETIVIHSYRLIRDGHPIDLLGDGSRLAVLRRESNLEALILDGRLTASFQPEDVRVGDIVELAYTQTRRDPALAGHLQSAVDIAPGLAIGHLHTRIIWPATKSVQWHASPGALQPTEHSKGNERELVSDVSDVTAARPPKGAPLRYEFLNFLQVSDFGSWAEVSRVMAPLYERSIALTPSSPLRVEAARIAARSGDPKARALAALQIAQDQIRYLLLAMEDGGYVPASADMTWSRRFGDCKGKTVLLLALLRELGIEAHPALVSVVAGDGLETREPSAGAFDHVLVEARIAGHTYWLDGTRQGDRDLDQLRTPDWHWALPLTPAGADLVKLVPERLTEPQRSTSLELDAGAGIDAPATVRGTITLSGDLGLATRLAYGQLSAADRQFEMREYWHSQYQFITPAAVDIIDDPTHGSVRLTMNGTAKMDWSQANDARWYELDDARLGAVLDTAREDGPGRDAPFAVDYPQWSEARETIRLPAGGRGFVLSGDNVDRAIGPYQYHRTTKIDSGVLTMTASTRTLGREIAFQDIEAVRSELAKLNDNGVYVRPPVDYRATAADLSALRTDKPSTADGYLKLGRIFLDRSDFPSAIADFKAATSLAPENAGAHGLLALAYAWNKDPSAGMEAMHALGLDAKIFWAWNARAIIAMNGNRPKDALEAVNHSLEIKPGQAWALQVRAGVRSRTGDPAGALTDLNAAIKAGIDPARVQTLRSYLLSATNQSGQALDLLTQRLRTNPDDIDARRARGETLFTLHRWPRPSPTLTPRLRPSRSLAT